MNIYPTFFHWNGVKRIISILQSEGTEVRFVGGCVRDFLAGYPPINDIDIATPDLPEKVLFLLEKYNVKAIPIGLQHGTITAIIDDIPFEITTLRMDKKTDGRHAEVEYTDDWDEDAARRDFTFNAMSLTPNGELWDLYGGAKDLKDGIVRFVGNPEKRILEDHLRILRYFRFEARFGKEYYNHDSLEACKKYAYLLNKISGERIQSEMKKILTADNSLKAITQMYSTGVLNVILPECDDLSVFKQYLSVSTNVKHNWTARLAALVINKEIFQIMERWKLSTLDANDLFILSKLQDVNEYHTDIQFKQSFYKIDKRILSEAIYLAQAESHVRSKNIWAFRIQNLLNNPPPEFFLRGQDLLDIGIEKGPRIGKLLKLLEENWIYKEFFPNNKEDYLKVLPELIREVE